VGPGDRVSILAANDLAHLDLFFACARIGAIFAPLNWRLAPPELAWILDDCTPQVLVVGPDCDALHAAIPPHAAIPCSVSLASYSEQTGKFPNTAATEEGITPETPHCLLYTSGTTGRPKGAIIPHRQVVWNCINTVTSWGLSADDVSPVFTPLFHAGGLFAFLTPLFWLGGRIVLARGFDPDASLRVIVEERCTVILGVPTLFQMWQAAAGWESADFRHVRFFISGGAPCPTPLIEAWRRRKGIVFRQGYGLTEVGPNCFSMTDAESVALTGSVGKPVFHSGMKLVDSAGAPVPPGETGELCIRGPHVCSGYWKRPDATAEALVDGWFHTGDMARMDAAGNYTIVGRFKDMIISGGENVYAAEVEAVCLQHPAVRECALIGRPDPVWGEVGLLIAVADPALTADALLAHCRDRLARYKVPKEVIFSAALPHSPYGKVEKRQLREEFLGV
jgi:fatty-acyl-CoA synthase